MNNYFIYPGFPGIILLLFLLAITPIDYAVSSEFPESSGSGTSSKDDTLRSSDEKDDESETVELEEVIVTATRTEEDVLGVSQHVTVITKDELSQNKGKDLAGIVEKEAGISLTDYGPEGSLQALSIRGCTTSQVLILINGVRAFNSHGSGDMSLIPIENIDRIEVVRGGASALYGADAVGGVINIITKKEDGNSINIKIENTSYIPRKALKGSGSDEYEAQPDLTALIDTQKANMGVSYRCGDFNINTSINGVLAANEYVFLDPTNTLRTRENAELMGGDASCNLSYMLPHGYISLFGTGVYHEQGLPGELGSITPDAKQKQTGFSTSLHMNTNTLFTDILTLDIKGYYNYFELDYTDPQWSVDSLHTTHSGGIEAAQEIFPADFFSILYGGIFHYEALDSTDMGNKERYNCAGFVEIPLYIGTILTLFPSLRYDYFSDFGNNFNFKAGAVWQLSQFHALKGSFAKSFRAPTFNDLYWPEDAFAQGNPELEPETGYCGDIGLTTVKQNYSLNLFFFLRYVKNVILWRPEGDTVWRPSNFGEGLYPGIEAQWDIRFLEKFSAGIRYTGIYSFALSGELDLTDNCRIPYVPVHALDARLHYSSGCHTFTVEAHYEGAKRVSVDTRAYLPPVFLLDTYYSYSVSKHFTLYAAIDNIFNEMAEGMSNYPLPGFTLHGGFECKILFK